MCLRGCVRALILLGVDRTRARGENLCLARLYMNASVPLSAMYAVSVSVSELTQTAGRNA